MTATGVIAQFQALAAALWELFAEGQNCRLRPAGVVHAVAPVPLLGGVSVPGARCHTGVAGGELGTITATTEPVTCRTCIDILRAHGELPGPAGELQLLLFALDENDV